MGISGAAFVSSGCATPNTAFDQKERHRTLCLADQTNGSAKEPEFGPQGDSREMVRSGPGSDFRGSIEMVVCRVFGVRRLELRLSTRGRAKVALARQVSMYLAHVVFGLSLTEVGRIFERDRTTVSHACGVIEDRRDDPIFDRVLENLEFVIVAWAFRRT